MASCTKCAGTGIIGSGPTPWLHEGSKSTCDECGGKGQSVSAPENQADNDASETDAEITEQEGQDVGE